MKDLIARLEKATAPSRRLDAEIIAVIKGGAPEDYEATSWALPRLTESLDAALTLVPDGANCHGYELTPLGVEAHVSRNNVASGHWLKLGHAATPALALTIAALKARSEAGEAMLGVSRLSPDDALRALDYEAASGEVTPEVLTHEQERIERMLATAEEDGVDLLLMPDEVVALRRLLGQVRDLRAKDAPLLSAAARREALEEAARVDEIFATEFEGQARIEENTLVAEHANGCARSHRASAKSIRALGRPA